MSGLKPFPGVAGGKSALQPSPGATLPATGRERIAAYDEETKFQALQREFEAYKAKCDPDTVKNVANRLDLALSERSPAQIFAKIETLKIDHAELQLVKPQLVSLPALQEASDILDTVIKNLSATLTSKAEIPTVVSQLVARNGQMRNKAVSDGMTLESRDAEIARLHKALEDANEVSIEHTQLKKDVGILTAQVALLPALTAASKTLDAVIEQLGGKSVVNDQDIPTLVEDLMFSRAGLQQKAAEDALRLQQAIVQQGVAASNAVRSDETISTLRAEIAELGKKAIDESSTDEVKRLNEELVAQRLTVERHENEAVALRKEIASLKTNVADIKSQKEAFELQIQKANGDMASTLDLLSAQENLVTVERTKTHKLTAYIMQLGGMIAEVPDILSSGWLKKELSKTVLMSQRQTLFRFDGLDDANLKLMQGHLQNFDGAMIDLYRRLKKTLDEHEELKLDNQAQTNTIKVKDEMIEDYEAYKTVLALGIIDMADHLKWIMAGLKAQSPIRRPVLVVGERWLASKKQILDLVIQFEGELMKVTAQRALNIENAKEIARLSAASSLTGVETSRYSESHVPRR